MSDSNVIPFAPALQRVRERRNARLALLGDLAAWQDHYSGGGIDELWAGPQARGPGAVIVSLR